MTQSTNIVCPYCGKHNDATSNTHDRDLKPSIGDLCMCIGCGNIAMMDKNIEPRKINHPELFMILAENEDLRSLLGNWYMIHEAGKQ